MQRRKRGNDAQQGKHERKLTRKSPRKAANRMCGSDQSWPVPRDTLEKAPGVPAGQTACLPNRSARQRMIVMSNIKAHQDHAAHA